MKRRSFFVGVLSAVEFLPLHPLLCITGAAAAGAGVYFYFSKLRDKKKTKEPEDPSVTDEVPQDQVSRRTRPPPPVLQAHCGAAEDCDHVWQASNNIQWEQEWIMKQLEVCEELLKELERDQEYCDNVMVEYNKERDALSHNLKLLQIFLSDMARQHRKASKFIAKLMHERANLMGLVEILRDTVQDIKKLITETQDICDGESEQEWQPHLSLQPVKEEMKENLDLCEQLPLALRSEAENKHQQALVTISLLESERTNLQHQLETLQDTINNLVQLNYETQKKNDEQRERERRATGILQAERDFMTLRLKHCEELLMVTV